MPLTRRDFLKAMGAGGGLAVLGVGWDKTWDLGSGKTRQWERSGERTSELAAENGKAAAPVSEWLPNICTLCVSGCGVKVKVDHRGHLSRAVKIDGNPADPFNQGHICARGQSGLRLAYSPSRITQPLIRIAGSKRGEWRFRAASWEEAYAYIDRVTEANNIQPYEKGIAAGWVICAYFRPEVVSWAISMGIPNIYGTPMQPCVTGEHFGIDTVTGNFNIHDEVQADYGNARYFLAFGSNAAVTGISTGRALRFAQGMKNNKVVVLDPRLSELAAHSDEWIPVRPGTDLAFALAMLGVIVGEGYYDRDFVTRHTNAPFLLTKAGEPLMALDQSSGMPTTFYVYDQTRGAVVAVPGAFHNDNTVASDGTAIEPALSAPPGLTYQGHAVQTVFDAFSAKLAPYTPEWAAPITDVPPATIRRVATEFGTTRPALVEPGWHDGRYGNSVMLRRAAALLQTLVGGLDATGGWIFAGEYHEQMAGLAEHLRSGGSMENYPPLSVPGLLSSQGVLDQFFDNPAAWAHGHPALSYAWSEQEFAAGREGVAFPLFPDVGWKEASKGDVSWKGEPYRLRSVFLYQVNPVRNGMSAEAWKEFLSDPEMRLIVAIDVAPNDSNIYADVILPDQVYLERQDLLFDLGHSHQVGVRLRAPSITPPPGTRNAVDVLAELAARQNAPFAETLAKFSGWDPGAVAGAVHQAIAQGGSATEAIAAYQLAGVARRTGQSVQALQAQLATDGLVVQESADEVRQRAAMPAKLPLPTPSGRAEIFSLVMAGFVQQHGPRPNWDPILTWIPPETPAGGNGQLAADEFYFAYGKAPVESHTATANNDLLTALARTRVDQYTGVWIHPKAAKRLRITDGDAVSLRNQVSGDTVAGKAYVTEMIRPDTVYMMSNFGVTNPKLASYGLGTALSSLVRSRPEPVVGAPRSGEFTVKVTKA